MDILSHLVDSSMGVEKGRVQSMVRQTHLVRNGLKTLVLRHTINSKESKEILKVWKKSRTVPEELRQYLCEEETDELVKRQLDFEKYVDGRVAYYIKFHPAYPWFSRVKGVGKENIGKVVAQIRIKPEQKEVKWCPSCGKEIKEKGEEEFTKCPECETKLSTKMIDLPYADTISALWKFAGRDVGEDGKAPKRTVGKKLTYNSQLRSMTWRLGTSLMRAQGKFYDYYISQKTRYEERIKASGRKIVPVTELPKINGKRTETVELISEGHVHNMALRKMVKLFLACLWLEWRKAEGLPLTKPYAIEQLGHDSFISPEEMCDRESREGD